MIILKNKYNPNGKKITITSEQLKESFELLKKLECYKSLIFKDGEIQQEI